MTAQRKDPGPTEEPEGEFCYPGLLFFKRKNGNKTKRKENLNIIMKKTCNKKLVLQEADRVGGVFIICCISKYMKCQCEGNSFHSNKHDRVLD